MCNHLKPDRCHHCRICGVCVLKMDHHCPWVNNCISYTNYKAFVLFLFYAFTFCSYIVITSLPSFLQIWKVSVVPAQNFSLYSFPKGTICVLEYGVWRKYSHTIFIYYRRNVFLQYHVHIQLPFVSHWLQQDNIR